MVRLIGFGPRSNIDEVQAKSSGGSLVESWWTREGGGGGRGWMGDSYPDSGVEAGVGQGKWVMMVED